jgi:hypothetical protein
VYKALPGMTLKNIAEFHKQYLSKKPQAILLIGAKDKLNFKALEQYGPVQELTLTELFGY